MSAMISSSALQVLPVQAQPSYKSFMEMEMEMPSKEESLEAFIGFLVEPIISKYGHGNGSSPSAAAHEEVAKQVQATVLLYNYYHRKQFPHLEFLDALTFCKTAVIMCTNLIKYMGILKGTDVLATEFAQHATLTVKMVKEACDICDSLNSPRTMPNTDALPISKVAVFIIDASYEKCILSFGSIIKGVWSLVEKNVDGFENFIEGTLECGEQSKEQGSNKRPFRYVVNTGETRRATKTNGTMPHERETLQQLAYAAVKEQTGIGQSDLKVFAVRVVYSLSKAKMSTQLYMMRCITDVPLKYARGTQMKWIPVKDALSSIEGPLLENVAYTYQASSTVSYFHLRPYVNAIRNCLPRKCFIDTDRISEAFESAQYNKISVASDHQEYQARSRKRNRNIKERAPKTACLNNELGKRKSDIAEESIDNSRAITVRNLLASSAADPYPSQHILKNAENSIHQPSSHFEVQSTATGKLMSTTKDGEASGQLLDHYSPCAEHTLIISEASESAQYNKGQISVASDHQECQVQYCECNSNKKQRMSPKASCLSNESGKNKSDIVEESIDNCRAITVRNLQASPAADTYPSQHILKLAENSIHQPLSHFEHQSTATGKLLSTTNDREDTCKASGQLLDQYSNCAEHTLRIAEASESAQYNKGQISVASDHQEYQAQSPKCNSNERERMTPKTPCLNNELGKSKSDIGEESICNGIAITVRNVQASPAADPYPSQHTLKHAENSVHKPSDFEVQSTATGKLMATTKDGEDTCKAAGKLLGQYSPRAEDTFSATKQVTSTLNCELHNRIDMEQDQIDQNTVNQMNESKDISDSRHHVSVTSKQDILQTEVGANAGDKLLYSQSKKTHFTPFQSSEQIQEVGNNLYIDEPTVKGLKFFERHLRKKQKFSSSNSIITASMEGSQNSESDPVLTSSIIIDPAKMHSDTVLTIINSFNKQIEHRVANYKLENEHLHQKIDSLYKFVQETFAEATNACGEDLSNTTIDKLQVAMKHLANNRDISLMKMNRELLSQYLSIADELEREVNKSFEKLSVATQESFTMFVKLHDWPTLLTMRDSNINQLICEVRQVTSECLTCKTMNDHISKLQESQEKTKKIQQWYESCPSIIMQLQNFKDRAEYHWKALNKVASWSVEETMDIQKEKPESADLAALYCNRFQNLDYRLVQALEEWDHFKKELLTTVPELKNLLQIIQ